MTTEKETEANGETVAAAQAETLQAGTLLKNKRESLGLTQKQIADRLRLRPSIIENIENNNFSSEQVATFTRGYLCSYARAVGLKEATILCALEDCKETQHAEHEMKSFSRKTKRDAHDSRIMTLTWGIIIVVLGISSVWWWQNQESSMQSLSTKTEQEMQIEQQAEDQQLDFTTIDDAKAQGERPSTENGELNGQDVAPQSQGGEALVSSSETVVEPVEPQPNVSTVNIHLDEPAEPKSEPVNSQQPKLQAQSQAKPEHQSQSQPQSQPKTERASSEQSESATQTTQAVVPANQLVMTFSDDCWIRVKDASGKTLATGVKKGGQSLSLSGKLPYRVILGAPENASMTLASEPVDLSGYTSGKVARFNLPK